MKKNETVTKDLKTFFEERGCEVIDKRASGGSLWVVGDQLQLKSILADMKKQFGPVSGAFSQRGGRATKHRAAWYTSSRR